MFSTGSAFLDWFLLTIVNLVVFAVLLAAITWLRRRPPE